MIFTKDSILINPNTEVERIKAFLQDTIVSNLRKRGCVVGVSGGIDSSVVLALCVDTFGPGKVLAVLMPEKESNNDSKILASNLCNNLQVKYIVEDISEAVSGFGCYRRRDEAVERIFPDYDPLKHKIKIILRNDKESKGLLNVYYLIIIFPDSTEKSFRLPVNEYLQIVAASNFKQRSRMSMLYYYADLMNYAVIGTGNKNEHEQGFFVKYGDGGADIKPISHLYKTQVFQLGRYLRIPEEICSRIPTTDTYSAEQTQEEFFFKLPFDILDRIWFGWEKGFSTSEISNVLGIAEDQVKSTIKDIKQKMNTTEYLRQNPISMN